MTLTGWLTSATPHANRAGWKGSRKGLNVDCALMKFQITKCSEYNNVEEQLTVYVGAHLHQQPEVESPCGASCVSSVGDVRTRNDVWGKREATAGQRLSGKPQCVTTVPWNNVSSKVSQQNLSRANMGGHGSSDVDPQHKTVDKFYKDTSKHMGERFKALRDIWEKSGKKAKPVKHMGKHVPIFATNTTKVALHFHPKYLFTHKLPFTMKHTLVWCTITSYKWHRKVEINWCPFLFERNVCGHA